MNDIFTLPWYDLFWFYPSTFKAFQWEYPLVLYGLIIVPLIFLIRWLIRKRFQQKLAIGIPSKKIRANIYSLVRLLPNLILLLATGFIILALARPQRSNERVDQWTEGIDIILTIDISQSMQIEDFQPNRLEAAKETALDFINGRFQDRIGLVIFSGDAYTLSPLTTDYELLRTYIRDINFEMIENRGTAIGSAIGVMTNRMRESDSKTKVAILLSDGDNTAGNIDPITAAELAGAYGIKIYSIAVGKEGRVPFGKDFFGRPRMIENTLDETTLRKIAEIGDGQFFRAADNESLQRIFDQIDQYEKAEIKETRYKDTTDYYYVYLKWAVALLLLWLFLKSTFFTNVLQD